MGQHASSPCAAYRAPWRLAGLPPSTPVLLALSGGADSRALLHLLYTSAQADGFRLLLAHVNHGIRGEESLRDRAFCQSLAKQYGLELLLLDADVPALAAESRRGLEEEARSLRYDYFAARMREEGIPILVTAHHANDNLETLLFRLCRGTGLSGLGGIAPVRSFANGVLVRPLLHCTRQEILQYCAQQGLSYVTDSTNADTAYARNKLRAEVIPVLESLFDELPTRIADATEELREDERHLMREAEAFLSVFGDANGLLNDELQRLSPPIRRRVLRIYARRLLGCELQRTHVVALLRLLEENSETQAQVALPGEARAVRELGYLRFLTASEEPFAPYRLPLALGETQLPQGIRVLLEPAEDPEKIHNLSTETCIIANNFSDIIEKGLYLRSLCEGDCILQNGMHKKLRKLYNAAKIPPRWRRALPLLCDAEGIVWAPFVGARDGAAVGEGGYRLSVQLSELPTPNTDP